MLKQFYYVIFFLLFCQSASAQEVKPSFESTRISSANLEERIQQAINFAQSEDPTIGYIAIKDRSSSISDATWIYVKKALDHYKTTKPLFIILELNTPGGEVFAAEKISDALKEIDTQYGIPCVAVINNWAISAGALLAYSCRFITVVKDSAMGAAEPVIPQQSGEMKEASEKVNSAFRADFANRAAFFDRNPFLAEAMVDKDMILVLREGKFVKLDNENQIITTAPHPDLIITRKGKLLTLTSEQLMDFGVADYLLPTEKIPLITPQEEEKGIYPANKTLLYHSPFFTKIPNAKIEEYKIDWKTRFFMLLAHPVVSSILFLGLMLGFYTEISTGGFGLGGTVAVTCLFLIILSSFALEIGNYLELILLVVGLLIILVEIFVLPTFGLLGIIGVLCFLAGLLGLMLPGASSVGFEFDTQTFNAAGHAFFYRLAWLCGTFVVGCILMMLLARYVMPSFSGYNRFVLKGNEQSNYSAVEGAKTLPALGSKGEVLATLRPTGKVVVNDNIYDALSAGHFIEKGTQIAVVGYDSGILVVEEIADKEGTQA